MSRVSPSDVLQAMSGSYREPNSIVAGGGGGGGHHGHRGHHGHHGHHGGRGRRRGFGGGPWWGYDEGVAVTEPGCFEGLYAPSGALVCPGDPGYQELLQSMRRASVVGAMNVMASRSERDGYVPTGLGRSGVAVVANGWALSATGALERRNPLPPGRYWVDVFQSKATAFNAWLARQKDSVRVETTESYPGDLDRAYESRDWVLFRVLAPVPWEGPGLPTVADAGVRTSDDTVQKPPPEKNPLDDLPKLPSPGAMGAMAALVGLGIFAVVMMVKK